MLKWKFISQSPDVLLLQLIRMDNEGLKIESYVKPDLELNVKCLYNEDEDCIYELKSIICHYGHNMYSGHYISMIS